MEGGWASRRGWVSKILIVVPDATRKAHLKTILPELIRKVDLEYRVQNTEYRIKIIVATGLHKPHTKPELKNLVGEKIFSNYEVITHTQKKSDLISMGTAKGGIPIVLNKNLFKAGRIMTIGLIEPHLYAGYSGGAKTIAIGLAGERTINATHHPRFLDKKGTAIGAVRNNPFQDCLWEIIKGLPIGYSINIVNDRRGRLKKIFSGDLKGSYAGGVKFAKKIFEKKLNKRFDAVICSVSPPKDVNMYQASRAFNYVLNTASPIVKKGGIVLVRASLKDGFGNGMGEKKFAAALKRMHSPQGLIKKVKSAGCVAGEHRAYMVAKAMTKAKLGFIGPKAVFYTRGLPFLSFPTLKSALKFIRGNNGKNAKVYTIPNALSMIIARVLSTFLLFCFLGSYCCAAPIYGPAMPKRGQWHMGFESNLVFDRDMKKGLGGAETTQFFYDESYGIYDWLSFDGRLGLGDAEFDTREAGHLDYGFGFAGAYGTRFRIYNNEEKRLTGIFGFQHISAHPPREEVNNVKYSAIWDEWQFSLLLAKGIGNFKPYAGIKASQLYIIRRDNAQNEWAWNGARKHFGVVAGSNINLFKNCFLDLEGRFIDETAFSAALNFKV